jgi:hypothetical protein
MPQAAVSISELIGSMMVEAGGERALEVVETGGFADDARKLLEDNELEELRLEVALLRQLGDVIPDTGGLRKMRWGANGKGKRGGARVLYYYGGDHMPVFLIAIYPKSAKQDISQAEKKAIRKLIEALNSEYRSKRRVS